MQDEQAGLRTTLIGMGSLSYGELAGERMKLGLLLNDPEEEHDCFTDNTHNSHYFDTVLHSQCLFRTLQAVRLCSVVQGPLFGDLVAKVDANLHADLTAKLNETIRQWQS